MTRNTQGKRDPRGRKTNPRGKILSNGLFENQWSKILEDAQCRNMEGAVLLREIIDWYYTAKEKSIEKLQGNYAQQSEFEKLPKNKIKKN